MPSGGGRRSHQGELLVAGAVEVGEGGPGRIRLARIEATSPHASSSCTRASWAPTSPPAARPGPKTAGPATPSASGHHTRPARRRKHGRPYGPPWVQASCQRSRPGRWASTTVSDANTCTAIEAPRQSSLPLQPAPESPRSLPLEASSASASNQDAYLQDVDRTGASRDKPAAAWTIRQPRPKIRY